VADEIIIDEYTLINHIATGGSTQVWEAVEKAGGDRHWAMKLMLPEALAESGPRSILKHEAKLTERFDHPNLVRFEKLVMNKRRGYMVMEYFRAPNLKMQLQTDAVSLQVRIARLVEQLCQVLGYLHELGWVHRDIKPDNILFNKASELRLIDFSLTTRAAGAMSKIIGGKERVIQGTRTYISPETILKAPAAPAADIYSLGVTLFEILTGEPPFRGSSPDDLLKKHLISPAPAPSFINDNVTPEMDRFILKMLAKKVKDRHKNTHEMLAEFRNIKPFKEDPIERDRRRKQADEDRYKTSLDKSGRLDSRADHVQQRFFKENPEVAKEVGEKRKALAREEAAKKEADRKRALAKEAKKLAEEQAASGKPANAPAAPPSRAAAPPPSPPASLPAAPPAPPMPGYPAPYAYPGYTQAPYPMAGYPPGAGYPPVAGYPSPPGYPPGGAYPPGGYPQGAYPQPQMQHPQMPQQHQMPPQQMPPQQMPRPQAPSAPGQPPTPGYPAGAPGPPAYGALPYGSQMRLPSGAPQPGVVPPTPSAPRPPAATRQPNIAAPSSAIDEQKELLQQLLGQPASPPAAPGGPVSAPRPKQGQPAAPRPAAQSAGSDLPLMDQLPPIK
jgi:serine/threonine-protein kinase